MRAVALTLCLTSLASANEPFTYDWRVDSAVTVVGMWLWIASENGKHELARGSCNWCERENGKPVVNAMDGGARDALRWSNPSTAESLSNAGGFGVVPVLMLGGGLLAAGVDHRLKEYPVDLLLFAESAVLAADVNQAVKFAVSRERPFVHFTDSVEARRSVTQSDSLTSFYSGHTTLAFAMATAAGTIAQKRHYRLAPMIWVLGMTLAATTGYLRIAADRHYLSDVLVGGAVGSIIGFINPYFVHSQRKSRVRPALTAAPGGALFGLTGEL